MSDDIYVTIADAHPINITIEDAQPIDIVMEAGSGALSNHNALSSLQGGGAGEYYHLLEAEYTELSNWLDNVTPGSCPIVSSLGSGEYRITNIRLDADLKMVITYDDVAEP